MKTLISIDPGLSTGVICGTYSDDTPFELTHAFQMEGGVEGFCGKFPDIATWDLDLGYTCQECAQPDLYRAEEVTVLVEKFNARGSANAGFSYTSKSLEALRVEGALIAMGIPITWVQPPQQYFLPGKDKAEKKKRQHAWLKENDYYIAPKELGTKDADDARSALAHCISWLRKFHKPTQELFRKDNND